MSEFIYVFIYVIYKALVLCSYRPTMTKFLNCLKKKGILFKIVTSHDRVMNDWLETLLQKSRNNWIDTQKILVLNMFMIQKWSRNINWNIWHACIEDSYISFIAGILHLKPYTGAFSKGLSEDTTDPSREWRYHQAI